MITSSSLSEADVDSVTIQRRIRLIQTVKSFFPELFVKRPGSQESFVYESDYTGRAVCV